MLYMYTICTLLGLLKYLLFSHCAQEMLVNMVRRFIFAKYPRPMAVTVFGNVLASMADVRELSSIKRHRQLANARAAAAAQEEPAN